MTMWVHHLKVDPLPVLQASANEALRYFVRRDLLDEEEEPADRLWELPRVHDPENSTFIQSAVNPTSRCLGFPK